MVGAVQTGLVDGLPLERVPDLRRAVAAGLDHGAPDAVRQIEENGMLDSDGHEALLETMRRIVREVDSPKTAARPS
ncbi:hypothetical protein [Aurantimonas sp. C2-5-R2]|uniref:hypothetical protein n=1 Tax=Aurantimonas sp. C2-5-R2 TaxID=3113713 RepID=UPI003FA5AC56